MSMEIGNNIRKLRQKRRWTQSELAKKVNKSSQVISNWERGYTSLFHDDIVSLAKAFDVPTDEILGNEINRSNAVYNSAEMTIKLLEKEAEKMGLEPDDPSFQKMISDALELLRIARHQDKK